MSLETLPAGALEAMRDALAVEVAALYLPTDGEQLVLERCAVAATATATHQCVTRLVFDEAAWRLVTRCVPPLVVRGGGTWLVDHPFTPPAAVWLLLPVGTLGLVIAT